MWTILKYEKKKFQFLKEDLTKKLDKNFVFYNPKIKIQKFKNNKLINSEIEVLGNYIFCFHKNFQKIENFNYLQFCRGLKYFLNGHKQSQSEIENFIKKCKTLEDQNGYISHTLFELNLKSKYKFASGPFVEKIFQIIDLQKNKINILMGNIKTTVKTQEFLFKPI